MRKSTVERTTTETQVKVTLCIDGKGRHSISTGVGFLDHMLELLAYHSRFDLTVEASGDTQVDFHHITEDIGLVLGQAIGEALGDKKGIKRYASFYAPMDEALALVVVDVSGRPYLVFNVSIPAPRVGDFDTELVEEFVRALCFKAGITMHINVLYGKNNHHISEAVFKGLAHALRMAFEIDPELDGVLSTKGCI
jgi:imidazoleglycerol-phosphate dehydratase